MLAINHDPEKWFKWFLLFVSLVTLAIFLNSCDCSYHMARVKKKCNQSFLSDTTIVRDTIYSTSVKKDSLFFFNQKDTVVIREGKLVMKYFYNDSTVYLKGECLTDTIYRDKIIVTNSTEFKEDPLVKYRWWFIGLFLVLLIIAILRK